MQKTELHLAYQWDCDNCGRENFVRAVVMEMSEEESREMLAEHGGDPDDWKTGNWMTRPDEVTCAYCGEMFATEEPEPGE